MELKYMDNKKKITKKEDESILHTRIYENTNENEGIEICLRNCKGNCVEFGVTGLAYCYEKREHKK